MSLAGALLSLTAMAVCNKTGVFGIVATSAAGGIFHNIGQLAAAMLLSGTAQIYYYLPPLLLLGLICGLLTGVTAFYALKNKAIRRALEEC